MKWWTLMKTHFSSTFIRFYQISSSFISSVFSYFQWKKCRTCWNLGGMNSQKIKYISHEFVSYRCICLLILLKFIYFKYINLFCQSSSWMQVCIVSIIFLVFAPKSVQRWDLEKSLIGHFLNFMNQVFWNIHVFYPQRYCFCLSVTSLYFTSKPVQPCI